MIRKETTIEEIVRQSPASVQTLSEKGIRCIACGEPVWGTLEDAAVKAGLCQGAIDDLIAELNAAANG